MASDAADTVSTFERSLERLDVEWTRVAPADLPATLREACTDPTIAAADAVAGVELPAWIDTEPTTDALRAARTGVSAAGIGVADYGSVLLPSTPAGSEPVSLFTERHVAVLRREDVVPGMPAAFEWLGETIRDPDAPSSAVVATGPSATADMGALVRGVHGPREVHVVILDEEAPGDDADDVAATAVGDAVEDGADDAIATSDAIEGASTATGGDGE